jgi:hypothetical protein
MHGNIATLNVEEMEGLALKSGLDIYLQSVFPGKGILVCHYCYTIISTSENL